MLLQDILTMWEYNEWANRRILAAASQLAPERFEAAAPFSYGSLRATLFHTLEAEQFWRILCQHGRFSEDWLEADYPTAAVFEQRWAEENAAMAAYLAGLTDADLDGIIRYTVEGGLVRERPLWHCLYHLVNHGTQHRAEAAAMLSGYGVSPGDLDFTLFLNERGMGSRE
jgi:uncharacterized damage-inducible protein DinB